MADLDEADPSVVDTEDGGALVAMDDDADQAVVDDHFANLAETLPMPTLNTLASDLLDAIERDKEARKQRDEQYSEGLARTGMGEPAPGGAGFDGASKVTHPMITEAAVDFSARVMRELFPPNGPVKDKIIGKPTAQKVEKARRKSAYMNWQLTKQVPEFRSELEQCLTQVPLGGAQYIKLYWSTELRRPVAEAVYIDDVLLPGAASNFLTAERKTHVQRLTEARYNKRVESGMYVDVDRIATSSNAPEQTESAKTNDKIEGKEADAYNIDGLRTIFEVNAVLDIENEGEFAPYLISICESSRKVLAVYRNWEPEDETRANMPWMAEFPCIPWRGAYPIGLIQLIGGMSAAATGALRALLDSAHIANTPGGVKLAGGSKGGQTVNPAPGEWQEIEGGMMTDDIRKVIMPFPVNPPSAVLFQLLGFLTDAGRSVIQTSFEKMADQRADAPVGTTLALIEQGMTVFAEIHGRMHRAMEQVLSILHRLNRCYMSDEETVEDVGELIARRSDFEGPMDIIPVSDPNIFSETQRFAQIQVISERAKAVPGLYDLRKVEELILDRVKVPNAKDLLLPKPEPQLLNAVNENAAAAMGRPVAAFPEQDHLAHIQTHMDFMMSPVFGMNNIIGKKAMPVLLQHLGEHLSFWYVADVYNRASAASGVGVEQLIDTKDEAVNQEFDKLMAIASSQSIQVGNQTFGQIVPTVVQQCIQFMQQFQSPMPMDPTLVAQQEIQRKAASDAAKAQSDAETRAITARKLDMEDKKLEQDRVVKGIEVVAEQNRSEADNAAALTRTQLEIASQEKRNQEDNETAMRLGLLDAAQGHRTSFETGTSINP